MAAPINPEAQRRIDKFGPKPEKSLWDGSVRSIKKYLEKVAKDPGSLVFENWSDVFYNDKDGWLVECQYRAKNSFGGYVRETKWFVIQNSRVADVKDSSAYKDEQ